jgi:hypothetical protein
MLRTDPEGLQRVRQIEREERELWMGVVPLGSLSQSDSSELNSSAEGGVEETS